MHTPDFADYASTVLGSYQRDGWEGSFWVDSVVTVSLQAVQLHARVKHTKAVDLLKYCGDEFSACRMVSHITIQNCAVDVLAQVEARELINFVRAEQIKHEETCGKPKISFEDYVKQCAEELKDAQI